MSEQTDWLFFLTLGAAIAIMGKLVRRKPEELGAGRIAWVVWLLAFGLYALVVYALRQL